jgi:hypothetical protein
VPEVYIAARFAREKAAIGPLRCTPVSHKE